MIVRHTILLLWLLGNGSANGHFGFSGSAKSTGGLEKLRHINRYPEDSLVFLANQLRMGAEGSAGLFRFEIADELTHRYESMERPHDSPVRSYWDTSSTIKQGKHDSLSHRLDRASIQISGKLGVFAMGKQPIPTGSAKIFTASSQTPRFQIIRLDEYEITQDAVALSITQPLSVDLRYLPPWRHQERGNFHIRWRHSFSWADIGLSAGRSDDKEFFGCEVQRDIGGSILRLDTAIYIEEPTWQSVIGIERALSRWWTLTAEAYFNDFGSSAPYKAPSHFSTPFLGRYYAGASLRWQFSPLWIAESHLVANLTDPSLLAHVRLSHSVTDEMDLWMGQVVNVASGSESEFGGTRVVDAQLPVRLGVSDLTYLSLRYAF